MRCSRCLEYFEQETHRRQLQSPARTLRLPEKKHRLHPLRLRDGHLHVRHDRLGLLIRQLLGHLAGSGLRRNLRIHVLRAQHAFQGQVQGGSQEPENQGVLGSRRKSQRFQGGETSLVRQLQPLRRRPGTESILNTKFFRAENTERFLTAVRTPDTPFGTCEYKPPGFHATTPQQLSFRGYQATRTGET